MFLNNGTVGSCPWPVLRAVFDGYTETEKIVHYQIDVWSAGGERGTLIWSGTTQSIDPASSRDVSQEISRLIVPELARSGVIPPARK